MSQSKQQQILFFRHCFLPQQGINPKDMDIRARVDSQLTTYENWKENIQPRAQILTAESYDWVTPEYVQNEIKKYEALRND